MSSQEYSLPPSLLYPFPFFKSLHEVQGSITPMLKPCHNFRFEFEHRHFVSIDTQKHGEGGSAASWMQMNRLSLRNNWSGMTLKYWMMVERYPNLKEEVGGSIPSDEISSLPDKKNCKVANCLMCFGARMSAICLPKKKVEK
jgi:hypothetical protein